MIGRLRFQDVGPAILAIWACLLSSPAVVAAKTPTKEGTSSKNRGPREIEKLDVSILWHQLAKRPVSMEEKLALFRAEKQHFLDGYNEFKFKKFLDVEFPNREAQLAQNNVFTITAIARLGEYDFKRGGFVGNPSARTAVDLGKVTLEAGNDSGRQPEYQVILSSGPDLSFIPYAEDKAEKLISADPSREIIVTYTFRPTTNDPSGSPTADMKKENFANENLDGEIMKAEVAVELLVPPVKGKAQDPVRKIIFSSASN